VPTVAYYGPPESGLVCLLTVDGRFTIVQCVPIPTFCRFDLVRFEFVVPGRPASVQTSDRDRYQAWKRLVRSHAESRYPQPPAGLRLRLTVVFLCGPGLIDVDNLIKPIQDALAGWAYRNDEQVTDVDSHRRSLHEKLDFERLPPLLVDAWQTRAECVYVRGEEARPLEAYL
jgi:crossover junction endodeoxyribonuclease RusA